MRTNLNVVTNCNVFGLAQDRVVSLWTDSYHRATQHLAPRHASKRDRETSQAFKRRGLGLAAMVAAARMAKPKGLAITGCQRQPVRHLSPALVTG
jgi:hypothetical protein